MKYVHRYWICPQPNRDEYNVFVVRYSVDTKGPQMFGPSEYLRANGEWVEYPPGAIIEAFCSFDGRYINPFVGTHDWREAVSSVVEHHIKPHFENLIKLKEPA